MKIFGITIKEENQKMDILEMIQKLRLIRKFKIPKINFLMYQLKLFLRYTNKNQNKMK